MAGMPKRGESGSVALLDVPVPPHSIEAEADFVATVRVLLDRDAPRVQMRDHFVRRARRQEA